MGKVHQFLTELSACQTGCDGDLLVYIFINTVSYLRP